ncbi:MAG: DUF1015 domain-containing protein [Candidatus Dormibacteraeota bacterium]|uniref:DUF1015 domain-containing protein n=1 Tax=Candidatus Amunia macphersoniae TaxID=3127014 RepID=A0A934KQQ9_9BACT|nr:DUF1015 domain-containing protein [Candidatus Dormibacteraeota bacterium]
MTEVVPLRGIRFNQEAVQLGSVLAPPYDVISSAQQTELYGRDLRNIVRVDYGQEHAGDVPGSDDRYTRAAGHLQAWLRLGVLIQDSAPAFYISEHHYTMPNGAKQVRRGIYARVRARPWEQSVLRPHERTMRGPKEDRLALMRATHTQTSAVFAVWKDAPAMAELLAEAISRPALAGGRTSGEIGPEKHLLWVVEDPSRLAAFADALAGARLYIADGHHRYETAAAYAAERAAAGDGPDADSQFALVYLGDADDRGLSLLPTHRLLRPAPHTAYSLDDLWMRLEDGWELEAADDLASAVAAAAAVRSQRHAVAVRSHEGSALLSRPLGQAASPREALDVVVLQDEVLAPAGVDADAIREGGLDYTRSVDELDRVVTARQAVLGFALNPATTAQMIAVADAGEVMPQKSTYFYPKVPTGLVLSPL